MSSLSYIIVEMLKKQKTAKETLKEKRKRWNAANYAKHRVRILNRKKALRAKKKK
jgi:hypothetical protein